MIPINPFSAPRFAPGQIPFFLESEDSLESLVCRFRRLGNRGQILGPHGTGKSSLLEALRAPLMAQGWDVRSVTLHSHQRVLPKTFPGIPHCHPILAIVDGFEQLSWCSRWWLKYHTRRQNFGLLVSAHDPVGLPVLFRTQVTPTLALRVVRHLTEETGTLVADQEVESRLKARGGNLREALFDLYDLHEARRRASLRPPLPSPACCFHERKSNNTQTNASVPSLSH